MSKVKKEGDRLGVLVTNTFKEYNLNFKNILILLVIFLIIPSIVTSAFELGWFFSNSEVQALMLNPESENITYTYPLILYTITSILVSLTAMVLSYFMLSGLIGVALQKKNKNKYELKETINKAFENFWRYVWFSIVTIFFLSLIFFIISLVLLFFGILLALVIPVEATIGLGVFFALIIMIPVFLYFIVYWSIGVYYLYEERYGVVDSLKKSYSAVKGRWWKTFAYILLIGLVIMIASTIISIPIGIVGAAQSLTSGSPISSELFLLKTIIGLITAILYAFVYPFSIIFFKNLYIEYKKRK